MNEHRTAFEVVYESGLVEHFSVAKYDLRSGEWVVRIIARERQDSGELPPGKIKTITRCYQN